MFGFGGGKKFSADDIPDLAGQVAIVTGGNTGIGEVSVYELARHGAKVYLAARSQERAEAALARLKEKDAAAAERVTWLPLDLADLESVKKAAETFLQKESKLHVLLNNAGVMALPFGMTKQGLELQNGTNVVGHAVFTYLLLPVLVRTSRDPSLTNSVRIVNLSSLAHTAAPGKGSWADLEAVNHAHGAEFIGTWRRYGQSKAGNILFTNELSKLLAGERIAAISVHPGAIATELLRGPSASWGISTGVLFPIAKALMLSPQQGALTSMYAATSPEVDSKALNGKYLVPIAQVGRKSALTEDKDGARGAELVAFVKQFSKDKVGVDVDELVRSALAKGDAPAQART